MARYNFATGGLRKERLLEVRDLGDVGTSSG